MFTYKELAEIAGVHRSTLFRWVHQYKKAGVFRKTSPGKLINRRDADTLAQLAGFQMPVDTVLKGRKRI